MNREDKENYVLNTFEMNNDLCTNKDKTELREKLSKMTDEELAEAIANCDNVWGES